MTEVIIRCVSLYHSCDKTLWNIVMWYTSYIHVIRILYSSLSGTSYLYRQCFKICITSVIQWYRQCFNRSTDNVLRCDTHPDRDEYKMCITSEMHLTEMNIKCVSHEYEMCITTMFHNVLRCDIHVIFMYISVRYIVTETLWCDTHLIFSHKVSCIHVHISDTHHIHSDTYMNTPYFVTSYTWIHVIWYMVWYRWWHTRYLSDTLYVTIYTISYTPDGIHGDIHMNTRDMVYGMV